MATIFFNANAIGREAGYAFVSPIVFDLLPGTKQYTNDQARVVKDLLPDLIERKVIVIEDFEDSEETKEEEPPTVPKTSTSRATKSV